MSGNNYVSATTAASLSKNNCLYNYVVTNQKYIVNETETNKCVAWTMPQANLVVDTIVNIPILHVVAAFNTLGRAKEGDYAYCNSETRLYKFTSSGGWAEVTGTVENKFYFRVEKLGENTGNYAEGVNNACNIAHTSINNILNVKNQLCTYVLGGMFSKMQADDQYRILNATSGEKMYYGLSELTDIPIGTMILARNNNMQVPTIDTLFVKGNKNQWVLSALV